MNGLRTHSSCLSVNYASITKILCIIAPLFCIICLITTPVSKNQFCYPILHLSWLRTNIQTANTDSILRRLLTLMYLSHYFHFPPKFDQSKYRPFNWQPSLFPPVSWECTVHTTRTHNIITTVISKFSLRSPSPS